MVLGQRYVWGGKGRVQKGVAGSAVKAGNFIVQDVGGDGKWDHAAADATLVGGICLTDANDGDPIQFIVVDPELQIEITLKNQTDPAATGGPADKRQERQKFALDVDANGYHVADLGDTSHDLFIYDGYEVKWVYNGTTKQLERQYVGLVKVLPGCCQTLTGG